MLDSAFWAARFAELAADENFGQAPATGRTVMVEYSSPNTNKPLHLGHIRNNLLGYSEHRYSGPTDTMSSRSTW